MVLVHSQILPTVDGNEPGVFWREKHHLSYRSPLQYVHTKSRAVAQSVLCLDVDFVNWVVIHMFLYAQLTFKRKQFREEKQENKTKQKTNEPPDLHERKK